MKKMFALLTIFILVTGCAVVGGGKAGAAQSTSASNIAWASSDWNNIPGTFAMLYVEDHTLAWPVAKATSSWASGLHYTRKCPLGANCIKVYSRDYGADGVVGNTTVTQWANSGTSYEFRRTVEIDMNRYYITGNRYQNHKTVTALEAVTHELGHALGLDHDNRGGLGVMYYMTDYTHIRISAYERNALKRLYGIR